MADTHTYKFDVQMSCGGCSGAIDRVLKKLDGPFLFSVPLPRPPLFSHQTHLLAEGASARTHALSSLTKPVTDIQGVLRKGVESHEVSLENQNATVVAGPSLSYETVLKTIAKTGKKVTRGEADGVEQSIVVPSE